MSQNEPSPPGVLGRVIAGCARNPFLTILLALALGGWGFLSLRKAPLDAIPDLSDVQVIVFTEWTGQSANLVEDQITYPLTTTLLSAPRVKSVRGQSMFGFSFVYVIFEDGTDIYWARTRVLEYLAGAQGRLPEGVAPTLGPDATGVGWVFEYALVDETGKHDLAELRSIQDWNLRYALRSIPGVAEVASVGGFVKAYEVEVDPNKLLAFHIPLGQVITSVRASNDEVGGESIELGGHEHMIRGRGYIGSSRDIEIAPVKAGEGGAPLYVKDLAQVKETPDMRRGFVELGGKGEVAGAIVVMRYGENALRVIDAVKERLREVEGSLPEGVKLVVTYDRSGLIQESVSTLTHTLIEEMIAVSIIIFFFILHARSTLVAILTLPLAVLLAFIPMFYQGLTANIMSLSGIAVAIGAMVDASIIMIENMSKHLEAWEQAGSKGNRLDVLIGAMQEVGPSLFFALLVITVSFIPVFTLEGTEGRLFKPLAFTKTYSMGFASILAVTLTPALAALLVRGKVRGEEKNPINRWIIAGYAPVVRFVVNRRIFVIAGAVLVIGATVPALLSLKSEFMPPLNEGTILYMPTAPPGMSITEAQNILQSMDRELAEFPEVESVFGKMGRAETPTDAAPIGMVETVLVLKPRSQWRKGLTWDGLIREMDRKLHYPGMPNLFWMPLQTRTEMLATGIRSPLGIQVFGNDLAAIERTAVEIERAISSISGTRSAYADRSNGAFYMDFRIKREEAARHGLSVKDVNETLMSAVGGMMVSQAVLGRERYPIKVRYAREFREDPSVLRRTLVATPDGSQIPISQVADIAFVRGPDMVRSEAGKLVGYVFVDPGDRAIADYVREAKEKVAKEVKLPEGIRLGWAGQFTYFERAKEKLKLVIPVTLLIVSLLLYLNTRSIIETLIVLMAVPFSLVGAVWLLYFLGYHVSVAVWVGVIALAGLDAETGVVMLLYLTIAHRRWKEEGKLKSVNDLREAIIEGAAKRIRPKLMTVLAAMVGLLPIMWSAGTGSDVMKRIAAPMVGGLVTSFILELTVYPAIFALWRTRGLPNVSTALE